MIDYCHFNSKNITPLYEFGYGLSYTSFNLLAHSFSVTKLIKTPAPLQIRRSQLNQGEIPTSI
jgi:beta-glucosidase